MQPLFEVIPDAGRSQVPHVRAQRFVAVQVPHLLERLLEAHQSQEPFILTHR